MSNPRFGSGYNLAFRQGQLSLGVIFPIEAHDSPVPDMHNQIELAQQAERLGFAALWSRDVPLLDPSFGDAGQIYDPWVWLGYVAAHTNTIALATGSIILPLRQPTDLAKAAASVDQLSDGRLIMGVATGDRPVEYSVYKADFDNRDESFRQIFSFIQQNTHRSDGWDNQLPVRNGSLDLLPKSVREKLPLLVTGHSRQSLEWIAEHADGWLMYPRPAAQQQQVVQQWQQTLESKEQPWKPFAQSLYIDLTEQADTPPTPIHLGYRCGRNHLIQHLLTHRDFGVNHIAINLRFCKRPVDQVMDEIAAEVMPQLS
jgi:luciferase-type oxidoreductase